MPSVGAAVSALLELEGVGAAVEEARKACTELRWHEALRRRVPEAAAESRVRGAWASADLDGARKPLDVVRDRVRGARSWPDPPDPVDRVLKGAVQATVETEHVRHVVLRSSAQALARLHVAAASELLDPVHLGRPRQEHDAVQELVDVGPPPRPAEVAGRLRALGELLAAAGTLPVPVVAALAHAEICVARPFVLGNGLVARALERAVAVAAGLDPTGVAVPEAGHLHGTATAYVGALTAYASGSPAGIALWLRTAAGAMVRGAEEGRRVCDAVLAGRLL